MRCVGFSFLLNTMTANASGLNAVAKIPIKKNRKIIFAIAFKPLVIWRSEQFLFLIF